MTYEVQFQSGGADYTVRAETIEDMLVLIQRVQALTKPAEDVWVEWHGGNRPVAAHCKVEVELRNGEKLTLLARYFRWEHHSLVDDIVRYRVCK